ncbi:MAG: hypothetical protein GY936_13435 [Ignavibacteriae bacterium]|nr:hypothetical protein [Ignavibacteriota bacterium]
MIEINKNGIYLLPNRIRIVGWLLLLVGIPFSIFRFYLGQKPEFFDVKVFAIYSTFLQTKYLSVITNNISEEISGLTILLGLFFLAFSKEKIENGNILGIRLRSLFYSNFLSIIFLGLSFLFIFGLSFVHILILNMYISLILFIIIFQYKLYKNRIIRRGL